MVPGAADLAPTLANVGDEPLISLDAVTVRLGRTDVLRDVSIDVERGEIVGLSGPNGSGKSTFLRTAATLLRPSAGRGTVLGATLGTRAVWEIRPRIGLLAHDPALYPELTLLENLELIARLSGRDVNQAIELLNGVGLGGAAERRVGDSSHGMCRRVDIARLFLTQPDLLLLDEAHAGLDDAAVSLIATLLDRTVRRGGAAVLVSHDAANLATLTARQWSVLDGALEPVS